MCHVNNKVLVNMEGSCSQGTSRATLQTMLLSQQHRLASETVEEREAKQDSESAFPLVMQSECSCMKQLLHVLHMLSLRLAPQCHAFV